MAGATGCTEEAAAALLSSAAADGLMVGREGRISGYTTPWRKAIVTLASGQKIEFFEGV